MKRKTPCHEPCEQIVLDALEPHLIPDIALLVLSYTEQAHHPTFACEQLRGDNRRTHSLSLVAPCATGCTRIDRIRASATCTPVCKHSRGNTLPCTSLHDLPLRSVRSETMHEANGHHTHRQFSFKPEEPNYLSIDMDIGRCKQVYIWLSGGICFEHSMPDGLEDFLVQKYMSLFGYFLSHTFAQSLSNNTTLDGSIADLSFLMHSGGWSPDLG